MSTTTLSSPHAIALMAPQLFAAPILLHFSHHKKNASKIHVRCSPRLGGELLKQQRHYNSFDNLSSNECRLAHEEVTRIDLENAATPHEADELDDMHADQMAWMATCMPPFSVRLLSSSLPSLVPAKSTHISVPCLWRLKSCGGCLT